MSKKIRIGFDRNSFKRPNESFVIFPLNSEVRYKLRDAYYADKFFFSDSEACDYLDYFGIGSVTRQRSMTVINKRNRSSQSNPLVDSELLEREIAARAGMNYKGVL